MVASLPPERTLCQRCVNVDAVMTPPQRYVVCFTAQRVDCQRGVCVEAETWCIH